MTHLDCSVVGCIYNTEKCCCKGDIIVEGKDAKENSGTCCGSFKERGSNASSNSTLNPSKEIDVSCEACHCRFNEEQKCAAEHIGIAGAKACTCGETECASFECCN